MHSQLIELSYLIYKFFPKFWNMEKVQAILASLSQDFCLEFNCASDPFHRRINYFISWETLVHHLLIATCCSMDIFQIMSFYWFGDRGIKVSSYHSTCIGFPAPQDTMHHSKLIRGFSFLHVYNWNWIVKRGSSLSEQGLYYALLSI